MELSAEDIAKKILAKEIQKQDAIEIFQQLDAAGQAKLLTLITPVNGSNNKSAQLKAIDQRDLTEAHQGYIAELVEKYDQFVPKSKANILAHQHYFVDQRRAFHLIKDLKKMHFQITYQSAEGAYIHDVDNNKYIDISGDMGVNLFGHKAPFIVEAIKNSLDQGIPLAGYSDTIFKASELICELTGHERALFTQSGTEAVMFAVRIARAATGKQKIVLFDGAYHGLSDAVAATKDMAGNSFPIAPGILQEFADQIIVLKYGKEESLDIIEQHAHEIATVLVEPVQSRHPYLQPAEFLQSLRQLTLELDIPMIFDEMITGFRISPKGAQGFFNVQADIATYGKIPGGGLPTGVICGSAKYMDIVDGGEWFFDDDSMPKAKRTGMAGTHSQNPLKIAAVYGTLREVKKRSENKDSCFWEELNGKTEAFANELNGFFQSESLPIEIVRFGSLFRIRFLDSYWGVTEALFFILLRMAGVETNIQGNCFFTAAHTDEDINTVVAAIKQSLLELKDNGFFYESELEETDTTDIVPIELEQSQAQTYIAPKRKIESAQLRSLLTQDLTRFEEQGV